MDIISLIDHRGNKK